MHPVSVVAVECRRGEQPNLMLSRALESPDRTGFVDRPVGMTNDTVNRIGTTLAKDVVARMHISRVRYELRLL